MRTCAVSVNAPARLSVYHACERSTTIFCSPRVRFVFCFSPLVGARCLVAREHKKRVAGPLLGCSVQDAAINGYYEPIPKDEQQDWRMRSESYSNAVDL